MLSYTGQYRYRVTYQTIKMVHTGHIGTTTHICTNIHTGHIGIKTTTVTGIHIGQFEEIYIYD